MNILITGSEGFVGSKLQIELLSLDHKVFLTDRLDKKKKNYFKFNLGTDRVENFTDNLKNLKIDLVIHLAAAKGDFMLSDDDFYRDNILATEALTEILEELKISNTIHFSTVSVYGHNNSIKDETAELNPKNAYGITKLASENTLIKWQQRRADRNLTILRPSVIYGEDNYANMYNLLSLLNKKFPVTIGNGNYVKSMIAVENLIDITIFTSKKMKGIQTYNCTDEPYPTLRVCMEYISEIDGFKTPMIKLPISLALILAIPIEAISFLIRKDLKVTRERIYKFSMATNYRSELIRSIGYKQRFSTKERLQNMAKWYKKIKLNP
jgi:nucleoside-diphosphate-sugar epimerase